MINYTTPTITLYVIGLDITGNDIYVSLKQGAVKLKKTGADITAVYETVGDKTQTKITLELSQTETAIFNNKDIVRAQVNWITPDGTRGATRKATLNVETNLLDEVIQYGA